MSEPYMGQILFAGFNYAPRNYANCDGGTLGVGQYQALFTLLGITFGGDGSTSFMLPDLRGRTPLGAGTSLDTNWQPPASLPGQIQGSETVTLTQATTPSHTHTIGVSSSGAQSGLPSGRAFAASASALYGAPSASTMVGLTGSPMTNVGASQPHPNMQPFTVIEAAIALTGIYPVRP